MLSNVPSWAVGVFGASFVIVATLISHLPIRNINDKIVELDREIRRIDLSVSRLWDSHKLSDNRKFFADLFETQLQDSNENHEAVLSKIAYYMMGSILAMYAASDLDVPDSKPREIDLLRQGDSDAYKKLDVLLESLRKSSQETINGHKIRKDTLIAKKQKLERSQKNRIFWFTFLNIFGLIVVLLKDLPVWKSKPRRLG